MGARAFTASCSQGLALMTEVIHFTSGMRFPVVMAIANRTLSVPVNIWADHQDTLVLRDSGWLQLYASTVQQVHDLMLCAFRVAEHPDVNLPCIVAYDGFLLSHASEPVRPIDQATADAFLPPPGVTDRPVMDPDRPLQFGEVLFPEWYPDFEYKKHRAMADSLGVLEAVFAEFEARTGRRLTPIETYRTEDAEVVLVGLGSMMQTACYAVDRMRERGQRVGVASLVSLRPFPDAALIAATAGARRVLVLDRDIGYGTSGMVYPDVLRALYHQPGRPVVLDFIIGTGGKDVTPEVIERCVALGAGDHDGQTVFWPDARGPAEGVPYSRPPHRQAT